MFQLDDKFLEEVGLATMPDEQRKPFLSHLYDELELRVGTKLSEGMSDQQLSEFESIIDRNSNVINNWLSTHVPNYVEDAGFMQLQQKSGLDANDNNLVAEYVATKWLEVNRPDYRDIVASVLGDLKKEIFDNRQTILGQ